MLFCCASQDDDNLSFKYAFAQKGSPIYKAQAQQAEIEDACHSISLSTFKTVFPAVRSYAANHPDTPDLIQDVRNTFYSCVDEFLPKATAALEKQLQNKISAYTENDIDQVQQLLKDLDAMEASLNNLKEIIQAKKELFVYTGWFGWFWKWIDETFSQPRMISTIDKVQKAVEPFRACLNNDASRRDDIHARHVQAALDEERRLALETQQREAQELEAVCLKMPQTLVRLRTDIAELYKTAAQEPISLRYSLSGSPLRDASFALQNRVYQLYRQLSKGEKFEHLPALAEMTATLTQFDQALDLFQQIGRDPMNAHLASGAKDIPFRWGKALASLDRQIEQNPQDDFVEKLRLLHQHLGIAPTPTAQEAIALQYLRWLGAGLSNGDCSLAQDIRLPWAKQTPLDARRAALSQADLYLESPELHAALFEFVRALRTLYHDLDTPPTQSAQNAFDQLDAHDLIEQIRHEISHLSGVVINEKLLRLASKGLDPRFLADADPHLEELLWTSVLGRKKPLTKEAIAYTQKLQSLYAHLHLTPTKTAEKAFKRIDEQMISQNTA